MKDFPNMDNIFNDYPVDISITFWKQILRSDLHGLIFS